MIDDKNTPRTPLGGTPASEPYKAPPRAAAPTTSPYAPPTRPGVTTYAPITPTTSEAEDITFAISTGYGLNDKPIFARFKRNDVSAHSDFVKKLADKLTEKHAGASTPKIDKVSISRPDVW